MIKTLFLAFAITAVALAPAHALTFGQAKTIAATAAPALLIDPPNPDFPKLFVVRKSPNGMPYSITLPSSLPTDTHTTDEQNAFESKAMVDILAGASQALGVK